MFLQSLGRLPVGGTRQSLSQNLSFMRKWRPVLLWPSFRRAFRLEGGVFWKKEGSLQDFQVVDQQLLPSQALLWWNDMIHKMSLVDFRATTNHRVSGPFRQHNFWRTSNTSKYNYWVSFESTQMCLAENEKAQHFYMCTMDWDQDPMRS